MTINDDKLRELQDHIAKNKPRPYNLDDPDELLRLYQECRGYLHTCHKKHGTDWDGRKFAMEALDALGAKTKLLRRLGANRPNGKRSL